VTETGTPQVGDQFRSKKNLPDVEVLRVGQTTVKIADVDPHTFQVSEEDRVIRITTLYNQYEVIDDKEAPVAAKKETAGRREKRKLQVGQVWERRSDGAQVKIVSFDKDEETGKIKLLTKETERETESKLIHFRRRFKHVSDPRKR